MFFKDITICYYCKSPFEQIGETIDGIIITDETTDHIIPRSKGGNNSPLNKIPACSKCNTLKTNYLPEELVDFIQGILSGSVRKKGFRKNKFTDDVLKIVLHNTLHLIETIQPFRDKLFKSGNLQKDYKKDELTFSELLNRNTEQSKHIKNIEFEVSRKDKSKIHYDVENWFGQPIKIKKGKRIKPYPDAKELYKDLKWTQEQFDNHFENQKHFHSL
jgi:hypothetical protein